jgi:hypothetical protein
LRRGEQEEGLEPARAYVNGHLKVPSFGQLKVPTRLAAYLLRARRSPTGAAAARRGPVIPALPGVTALYQVDSQSPPTSRRFIDWGEPGTASPSLQIKPKYGVPYFLSTEGFAEAEFWQIANSVRPVGAPRS